MSEASYSKLVDGYKRAFIDSSVEAEPAYTPQFISNYRGNKVLTQLENELRECSSMFMSVAFITGGGIAHLKGVLKEMEAKNVPGRILTTDYLLFSEPAALDALAGLSNLEVRMFRTSGVGFHTKGYLFHNGNDIRIMSAARTLLRMLSRKTSNGTRRWSPLPMDSMPKTSRPSSTTSGKVRSITILAGRNMKGSIRKRSLKRPL